MLAFSQTNSTRTPSKHNINIQPDREQPHDHQPQTTTYSTTATASSTTANSLFDETPRDYSLEYPSYIDLPWGRFDDLSTGLVTDFAADDFDTMQSDTWGPMTQFTPKMTGRFSHQRESSLSSLGSAGPASPFTQNTSNPQIAVTEAGGDGLPDLSEGSQNNYYQLSKSLGSFPNFQHLDTAMPEMAYPVTIPGPTSKSRGHDRNGLLPAPELSGNSSRSHPASVSSSIAGDSPATPTMGEPEATEKRRKGAYGNIPKLNRTLTDAYGDELYNPNFVITSTSPSQPQLAMSPVNDVFTQRLSAANSQHLTASPPVINATREMSPFQTNSQHASSGHGYSASRSGMQLGSAQQLREQNKAHRDAQLYNQHMGGQEPQTPPKTISPKDAILEFTETEGADNNFPLFPPESAGFEMDQFTKSMLPQYPGGQNSGTLDYLSQMPAGLKVPQQYPFVSRMQVGHDTPPRLSSAGSSSVGSGSATPAQRSRPLGTAADGGTYTCTYHGCTLRFDTPSLLQKHKREGHRQTQGIAAPRVQDTTLPGGLLNTQAGPHRCDRINPSTGKPCSTVFSRPYDLTRHEDTIHNGRKQKVRCNLCTEEKTFSRADALTRHYRVCHPDVELPGKHRRRG